MAKVGLLSEKRRARRDTNLANNVARPEALGRGDVDALPLNTALEHALGPTEQ